MKAVKKQKSVKEQKKSNLLELIYQDKKELAKNCSTKYFKNATPATLEEKMIEMFSQESIRKHLKTKFVVSAEAGTNIIDELVIIFRLGNIKTAKKDQSASGILDVLGKAMSRRG